MQKLANFFVWTIAIFLVSGVFLAQPVFADYYRSHCCANPRVNPQCINIFGSPPPNCIPQYCEKNERACGSNDVIPDSSINPNSGGAQEDIENLIQVNIYGINLRLNSDRAITQIIFLGFSIFLAIAALAAAFIGVKAAIDRADSENEDKIKGASKSIQNAMVGFALIVLSLVIVQLVAAVIGVGSIFQLVTVNTILPN